MAIFRVSRYTPVNGGTVTIAGGDDHVLIDPAGPLLSVTLALGSYDSEDGLTFFVHTTKLLTLISYNLNGGGNGGLPATLLANTGFTMYYVLETSTWYAA
ncbi:MAG: hypothetical protein MN733_05155 [Nitrososphaera sp.]|nr:hypothetical protein [Nitrososphaera sp.]